MKNKFIESSIARNKLYAKKYKNNRFYDKSRQITVYHDYSEKKLTDLSSWDDVGFVMGSKVFEVSWIHPRYAYREYCDELAYDLVMKDRPVQEFQKSTPIYRYLGKNKKRKKVVAYRCNWKNSDSSDFYARWQAMHREICETTDYVQKPFIKFYHGYQVIRVEICIPIEVLSADDLLVLKEVVSLCYKSPKSFERQFDKYEYSSVQYVYETENH